MNLPDKSLYPQQVAYLTLECNQGQHENCPGAGRPFGDRDKKLACQCIHHRAGVVLPEGFPGRT